MGEMAEMMLDGTLCEACGSYIDDGDGDGIPRYCSNQCARDRGAPHAAPNPSSRNNSPKVNCPTCRKYRPRPPHPLRAGGRVMGARGEKVEVKCARCKQPFMARVADRKRGWGKFCSKSCKAIKQEHRTGQFSALVQGARREQFREDQREFGGTPQFDRNGNYQGFTMNAAELAGGGYGDADRDSPFGEGKW